MANGESSNEANLNRKVARIEQKLNDLKAATSTSVWVGRGVLLIISLVIIFQVISMIKIFTNLDKEAYARAAQEELEAMLPHVQDEVAKLGEKLLPVYRDAFVKEFDEGMPVIALTFSNELDKLVNNVSSHVNTSLEKKFGEVLDKQLDILAKDLPEIKDPAKREVMMTAVLDVSSDAAERMGTELFKPQIDALSSLHATLESAAVPQKIAAMNDTELFYFTTQRLGDLLALKLVIMEDVFGEQAIKEEIQEK